MKRTVKNKKPIAMVKMLISLMLILAMTVCLAACGGTSGNGSESGETSENTSESSTDEVSSETEEEGEIDTESFTADKVVMTYVSAPLNVPSILEKNRGEYSAAYAELGVGFDYSELTSGADQTAALASGDIQILNAVGASSVILAAAGGLDIRIISMYSRAPKAFAMFTNDTGISSPKDLVGKSVAGPKGTILHELLVAYLSSGGISIDQVEFINMDIPSAVSALENGSVDVALAGGTAAYNLEKAGKTKICDGEGLVSAAIVVAVTESFAEENPGLISIFKETQQTILEYLENNEDDALQITADYLDMDIEDVRAMYPLYDFSAGITDDDIESIKATEEFMYEAGMIENHVDVDELIMK